MTKRQIVAKRKKIFCQMKEAQKTGYVSIGRRKKIPIWAAYRCLYCGEYFSRKGAEEHFGLTRKEYFKREKRKEARNKCSIR